MSLDKDAVLTKGGKMSAAGIVDDPTTQTRVIPESRRADGSIRKERKVKPGFTPAEDIGRFRPSRVLRAQEEEAAAAAQQIRGRAGVPGSESCNASPSSASPTTLSPAPAPTSMSDGPWRRAESSRTAAKENTSSNGRNQPGSSWRQHPPKATVPPSTSSKAPNGQSWRRLPKADVDDNKKKDASSVPDSWDTDESSTDAQVEREQPKDTIDTARQREKEEDSIGTITEKLDSLQMEKSKNSKPS